MTGHSACPACGHPFDQERLGRYGCPNCHGEGLHRGRGLGIACPPKVAACLRKAGWAGRNGWWLHRALPAARLRWYDALAAEMRGDTSSRRRRADREALPERCAHTADMFDGNPVQLGLR